MWVATICTIVRVQLHNAMIYVYMYMYMIFHKCHVNDVTMGVIHSHEQVVVRVAASCVMGPGSEGAHRHPRCRCMCACCVAGSADWRGHSVLVPALDQSQCVVHV